MPEKEIRKRARILSAIAAIHNVACSRSALEDISGMLVKELSEIFDCTGCAIFLRDVDGENILASIGCFNDGDRGLAVGDMPLMRYLASAPGGIFSGDLHESPAASCFPEGHAARSVICTPVEPDHVLHGFVYLGSQLNNAFCEEDLQIAAVFAGEIARAMELSGLRIQVEALKVRDDLTGCLNHRKFNEDIEIEIPCADRYGRPMSLLMISIDHFAQYNDLYGQDMADSLLREMGETLSYSIRMCDKLYRYRNEEFALILPGIDRERGVFAAKRLLKVIGQKEFGAGNELPPERKITVSIGVASFPTDAVYKDGLIKCAEASVLRVRQAGGNAVGSQS